MIPVDPLAIRAELARVLASPGFAHNERLSRFLRFVVERHLEGRENEIKESVIGVEVFNRRSDFDPRQDSVVRTEAARLRSRLGEYYAGPGRSSSLRIEVPKGGYTPIYSFVEPPGRSSRRPTRRRWATTGVAVAGLALLAAGAWMWRVRREPYSIAVLPLENLNQAPDTDYLANGLTDEIIHNLSIIEGLAVRSRTSSFALKGNPRNARDTGRALAVDYLVEGSVLRMGSRIRVDAQLIRVRDDVPLWSQRFDRGVADVFAVQDEISTQVANSLRLQLGHGRRRYETSAGPYDTYLRARQLSNQIRRYDGPLDGSLFRQAFELYTQVVAQDPHFAPAYAALASDYALRSVIFPLDHPSDELVNIRAMAEKAIQLDPLLAEAHAALGSMYARSGEWAEAEQSFRRAIQIDPNGSIVRADYAYWVLAVEGRLDEALTELRLAKRTDPLSPRIHRTLATVLTYAGQYDEAAEYCDRAPAAIRIECLARVRAGQGRTREMADLLERDPTLNRNPQTRGLLGYAYARSGRRDEARRMAAQATFPNEQALILAGLGDKDGTFEALGRMAALGPQRVGLYLNYPELTLLRGDPRLTALDQRLGISAQAERAH
jgi:TolB-like protein/Flp pilus assembly protein TadD